MKYFSLLNDFGSSPPLDQNPTMFICKMIPERLYKALLV